MKTPVALRRGPALGAGAIQSESRTAIDEAHLVNDMIWPHGTWSRASGVTEEERQRCQPWLNTIWGILLAGAIIWLVLAWFTPLANLFGPLIQIPGWIVNYILYRRIRRRVEAKVAAELGDGRLWKCVECGYVLRASEERCPECGASIRVGPKALDTGSGSPAAVVSAERARQGSGRPGAGFANSG